MTKEEPRKYAESREEYFREFHSVIAPVVVLDGYDYERKYKLVISISIVGIYLWCQFLHFYIQKKFIYYFVKIIARLSTLNETRGKKTVSLADNNKAEDINFTI